MATTKHITAEDELLSVWRTLDERDQRRALLALQALAARAEDKARDPFAPRRH